jgi:hypothetical protein
MLNKLVTLSKRIDQLKTSSDLEKDFRLFLGDLRTLKDEHTNDFSNKHINDQALLHQIISLIDYKTYDQLGFIDKFLIRYFLGSRPGAESYKSWRNQGKFLYDIYAIEIRLNAIIFKLRDELRQSK